jgi:hypothetical protein
VRGHPRGGADTRAAAQSGEDLATANRLERALSADERALWQRQLPLPT